MTKRVKRLKLGLKVIKNDKWKEGQKTLVVPIWDGLVALSLRCSLSSFICCLRFALSSLASAWTKIKWLRRKRKKNLHYRYVQGIIETNKFVCNENWIDAHLLCNNCLNLPQYDIGCHIWYYFGLSLFCFAFFAMYCLRFLYKKNWFNSEYH